MARAGSGRKTALGFGCCLDGLAEPRAWHAGCSLFFTYRGVKQRLAKAASARRLARCGRLPDARGMDGWVPNWSTPTARSSAGPGGERVFFPSDTDHYRGLRQLIRQRPLQLASHLLLFTGPINEGLCNVAPWRQASDRCTRSPRCTGFSSRTAMRAIASRPRWARREF
jgi:hypothetical protein